MVQIEFASSRKTVRNVIHCNIEQKPGTGGVVMFQVEALPGSIPRFILRTWYIRTLVDGEMDAQDEI